MLSNSKQLQLPLQFEMYRHQLEMSALSAVIIKPQCRFSSLIESKLSGFPYLPKYKSYPKDIYGNYMNLLAQINLSEFTICDSFPNKGLLQFFITTSPLICENEIHEDIYQHFFKVRYYHDIYSDKELVHDFSFLPIDNKLHFPIKSEMSLQYSSIVEPVSATDYRLAQYLQISQNGQLLIAEDGRPFKDHYIERFLGAEHKIGGYPYFVHHDPRQTSPFLRKYDTLLLQIVSNDEQGIMWGDCGILKFFINKEKLEQKDFSDIYFLAEQY